MQFQIPYLAFRPLPLSESDTQTIPDVKLPRKWMDVSFLVDSSASEANKQFGLAEAQISVLLCGSDNWRWVVYSLVDTYFDKEEDADDEYDEFSNAEEFVPDPIVSDELTDLNLPIWDPRAYFLTICDARSNQVLCEWENIRSAIERVVARDVVYNYPLETCYC
jgi:hypothetical protein